MVGATGFEPATSCTPCKRAIQAAPRPELKRKYTAPGYRNRQMILSIARMDLAEYDFA